MCTIFSNVRKNLAPNRRVGCLYSRNAEKTPSRHLISRIVHKNLRAPVQGYCFIITCAGRARGTFLDRYVPPLPSASHGPGALYCGKGVRATNIVYAIISILAAAAVVTVAFLVITDLMP